jgi:hypothetical protein
MSSLDADLRSAFRAASAAYLDAEQNTAEQSDAKALVGVIVGAVLERHDWVGAKVRERKFNARYGI